MDFENGTVIIDEPGYYCLEDNIVFNPNSLETLRKYGEDPSSLNIGRVMLSQMMGQYGNQLYDAKDYGVGFFAAIAVSGHNITLDLNGYTLEQSKEHALLQRFYSNIEVGQQPFIGGQGPHSMGELEGTCKNLTIKNGILSTSSHHGIHGNAAQDVHLKDLVLNDFEVAAIALNGSRDINIKNVEIKRNRQEIPVLGIWSAGRFILPYLEHLITAHPELYLRIQGKNCYVQNIYDDLVDAQANVYEDIVTNRRKFISRNTHPDEYDLFHNWENMMDGNVYGIVFNKLGVAVNAFPTREGIDDPEKFSQNICIDDVHIESLRGCHIETLTLKGTPKEDGSIPPQNDPIGSVFQIFNQEPGTPGTEYQRRYLTISSGNWYNAQYIGTVISNAQAVVAKAVHHDLFANAHLDVSRNSINNDTISWIEADPDTDEAQVYNLLDLTDGIYCNVDVMFHIAKGNIGFKLDNVNGLHMSNSGIENLENRGPLGSLDCNYSEDEHMPLTYYPGYNGADARGVSIAGSQSVNLYNVYTKEVIAYAGSAYGIDVHTDSTEIDITNVYIHDIHAGANEEADSYDETEFTPNPNRLPYAAGLNIRNTTSKISYDKLHIEEIFSMAFNFDGLNDSQNRTESEEQDDGSIGY